MRRLTVYTIIVLLGLYIALKYGIQTHATEADFEVKPSRLDLMIKPGQKVSMIYKITNYGDPQTFAPKIMNAAPDSGSGTLVPSKTVKTPMTFTFANGRHDTGEPVFLKTNQTADIPVTIEAAAGEQKDYYYYFLAELQPTGRREGKTSVQIQPRIGVPAIISLANIAERQVKSDISVFKLNADYSFRILGRDINLVETGSKVPITLLVSNLGSNFITPTGKITVKGSFGGTAEYSTLQKNIYAQSGRLMLTQSSLEKACPAKNECKRFTLIMNGLLFGRYTVVATVGPADGGAKSFRTISFIAFPFKPVIAIIIFSILYAVLQRTRKPGHKKKP